MKASNEKLTPLSLYGRAKGYKTGQQYIVRPHIQTICTHLEMAVYGQLPDGKQNLIINIPPRHSKTQTVMNMVEQMMGKMPDCEFILTSYAKGLAARNVTMIRNNIKQRWYQEYYPKCQIDKSSGDRMDNFYTTEGGCVYGAGMDGTITGFGAGKTRPGFGGAIIIDDPIKPTDARHPTRRSNCIDFYNQTLKSRRNSHHTPIILIMQRTHPEDLSGYLLAEEREDWHLLDIPAMNMETQEVIWPERITAKQLLTMMEVDPFTFWTQYQQKPINPGGGVIKDGWWNYYDSLEEAIKLSTYIAIFADTAYKKTDAADYTVFQVWGFAGTKHAFLLEQIRAKMDFPELLIAAQAIWKKWQKHPLGKDAKHFYVEDKASGQSLIQSLALKIGEDVVEAWVPAEYDAPDDKVSRAKEMAWLVYGGTVWLPNPDKVPGAEWIDTEYLPEWREFREDDGHKHDDQIDASTMATLTWRSMGGGWKANKSEESQ